MSNEQTHIVISRFWQHPAITVEVSDQSIGIRMPISEFIAALASETERPATILTQAQLAKRLTDASDIVCRKMKKATIPVMAQQKR